MYASQRRTLSLLLPDASYAMLRYNDLNHSHGSVRYEYKYGS
jgi:hypothetical protein